ncbi:MAG: hypothetical protein H6Q90_4437 [Deltaproteobacteria bacterium]|nr:hypothetical protein [Deltaproteobacteria bacterium]
MKMTGWLAGTLVAGCVVLGFRTAGGCLNSSKAPDEKLAARLQDLCEIARDNVETPERGVRALGNFFGKHTEDLLGELGATMQVIENISDDTKHDDRAHVARDRIQKPLRGCERDWNRFGEAVQRDPAASAMLEHAMTRISRTLEIIFKTTELDFRTLPAALEHRLLER